MLYDNPATRLHQILTLCKKHEKDSGNRLMLLGWRKVLRMAESVPDFAVLERIGLIYVFPGQIAERIQRFDDLDPALYLAWREELEDAFLNLSFQSEFNTFVKRVTKTLLANIEFCSRTLSERCPEPVVEPDQLLEIGRLCGELIKTVPTAELDAEEQQYLQDYLMLIRRAVDDYALHGSPGLQNAVDACTGSLVTRRQASIPTREAPVGKEFWSLISNISKTLSRPQGKQADAEGIPRRIRAVLRHQAA